MTDATRQLIDTLHAMSSPGASYARRVPVAVRTLLAVADALESESAKADAAVAWANAAEEAIRNAAQLTGELCSCGGCGPDDPNGCDACRIYHELKVHSLLDAHDAKRLKEKAKP